MNGTAVQRVGQLENATQAFRYQRARKHRRQWVLSRRIAKEAIEAWDPTSDDPRETPMLVDGWGQASSDPNAGSMQWVPGPFSTEAIADQMQRALSMAKWHEGRDNGQKYRFKHLRQCGTRVMTAACGACGEGRAPVAEGCGITRLCEQCSLRGAKKRRARFGRARSRVAAQLGKVGYLRHRRGPGGKRLTPKWTDKMLTLTCPHFLRAHIDEDAKLLEEAEKLGIARADVTAAMMRVFAFRAAWPLFARMLRGYWKAESKKRPDVLIPNDDGSHSLPPFHRAFEWTPGKDGLGHPHFHIWLLSPWADVYVLAKLWTKALAEVGVPVPPGGLVRIKLQRFRDFNGNATGELVKAGNRRALEWSRLYTVRGGRADVRGRGAASRARQPANAFTYADGWTIQSAMQDASVDVLASLYIALEGMRLVQASRGFFVDDEAPCCEACRMQLCWHVSFSPVLDPNEDRERAAIVAEQERGPPCNLIPSSSPLATTSSSSPCPTTTVDASTSPTTAALPAVALSLFPSI